MGEFCASAHERDWRAERGFTWIAFTQPADLQRMNTSDVSKISEGLFMLSMQDLVHTDQTGSEMGEWLFQCRSGLKTKE